MHGRLMQERIIIGKDITEKHISKEMFFVYLWDFMRRVLAVGKPVARLLKNNGGKYGLNEPTNQLKGQIEWYK